MRNISALVQILRWWLNLEREAVKLMCACGECQHSHMLNILDWRQSGTELFDGPSSESQPCDYFYLMEPITLTDSVLGLIWLHGEIDAGFFLSSQTLFFCFS